MSITHSEVRRHPRWREQVNASQSDRVPMSFGARLVAVVGVLILATTITVLILKS